MLDAVFPPQSGLRKEAGGIPLFGGSLYGIVGLGFGDGLQDGFRFCDRLDEIAFLFFVGLVLARCHVVNFFADILFIRGGLLVRDLRPFIGVAAFDYGIRNFRREQLDGPQRIVVSRNDPVHLIGI